VGRTSWGKHSFAEQANGFYADTYEPTIRQPISKASLDEMTGQIQSAAGKAGVGPDLIYAMKKTGTIVTESNQHLLVVFSIRLPGSLGVSLPCRKWGQDDLVVLAARAVISPLHN
jgi:hypothetical protein